MKVSELYRQVAQLGFEETLENGSRFYYALNRALLQVAAIRPAISSYIINHRVLKNLLSGSSLTPIERSKDLCFEATGAKSYYFEADGNGQVNIDIYDPTAEKLWRTIHTEDLKSSGNFVAYKGLIKDGKSFVSDGARVRLCFTGNYLYYVKNIAMYSNVYSDDPKDIPEYGAFASYDMSKLTDDFLSFDSPPIKADGDLVVLNQGYRIEGNTTVVIPYNAEGCYKVLYKRKPKQIAGIIDPSENETVIDLDPELCELMPLLIAAYIWLEDEPDMAGFYLNLYRERAAEIELRTSIPKSVTIRSVNGW